jgi:tellurite resistance protein
LEWLLIIGFVVWLIYLALKAGKAKPSIPPQRQPASYDRGPAEQDQYRRPPTRPLRKSPTTARWVPAGEAVTVGGITINGGMIYLGGVLPGQYEGQCGNCVIDPDCVISTSREDPRGDTMPYWPSYQSIQPVARRTYLRWLATGRKDPAIGIGYIFLFFYGLERRLFVDNARTDAPALAAEVRRLLDIYGENGSFKGYASQFLAAADIVNGVTVTRPALSPNLRSGYEIPLTTRVYLGNRLASGAPLDNADALLWVLSLPDCYLRTPATRCFPELMALWEHRFNARHPGGLKVNAPRTPLRLDYRSASGGFSCRIEISEAARPVPDIAAISAPLDGLRDLLGACTDDLAPYSRLLGKKPEARGTTEAAFLMPAELLAASSSAAPGVTERIQHLLGGGEVSGVKGTAFLEALSLGVGEAKVSSATCNQIGAFLDRLDIGFEPDRRYGSRNLEADGWVLLFRAPGGGRVNADVPAYKAAKVMVDIALLAAAADGVIDAGEFESIRTDIRTMPGLGDTEKLRLVAYASVLLKGTPSQQAAMKKLGALDGVAKEQVIKSATAAILADGHASPTEVRFLERLFKSLGLPAESVYATLHRGAVVIDEPVPVAAEQRAPGVPIPKPPAPEPARPVVRIDSDRLERLRSETSAVSALLAGIFVEDDAPPAPEILRPAAAERFPGLDGAHTTLLESILDGGLQRPAFDDHARTLRLLPDGAIERINDWGFDRFDEAMIEEDEDRIAVAEHIRAQLIAAEAAE